MRAIRTALASISLVCLAPGLLEGQDLTSEYLEQVHGPEWTVKATMPRLIGGYGDNFDYDGSDVKPLDGVAYAHLNSESNDGWILAKFTGTIKPSRGQSHSGEITMFFPMALGEGSGTPLFVSRDAAGYWEGGVADYVLLHGHTGREAPVMPAIPAFVATWGPALVFVNGERVMTGPGHMMLTERSRDPVTGAVYADENRTQIYDPRRPGEGVMFDPDEKEITLLVHTEGEDAANYPPYESFLHVSFGEVEMDASIPADIRHEAEDLRNQAREMLRQAVGQ